MCYTLKSTCNCGSKIKDEDPRKAEHLRALGKANYGLVSPSQKERHFTEFKILKT